MKNKLFVLAIAFLLLFPTSCSQPKKQKPIAGVESSVSQMGQIENVKITANTANIKSGCSATSPTLQSANKDTKYDVVSQVSDWYAVKLSNNQIGFVPKDQSKPIVVDDNRPNIPPATSGSVSQAPTAPKTPTANTNTSTLTADEQKMLNMINTARAQNKLAPLKADMALTNVARIKAQDMITNNYFSHNSPKYGSPFDMMKAFAIKFVKAGENIAGNQSVEKAEDALMNSPGHRQNILSPDYTHIGIGIKAGGPYGNMFSQMFISKPQ